MLDDKINEELVKKGSQIIFGRGEEAVEDKYFSKIVMYYVAPTDGIQAVERLQRFMDNLLPSIEESCRDDFKDIKDPSWMGRLYFDEDDTRIIVCVFPNSRTMKKAFGIKDYAQKITPFKDKRKQLFDYLK
ncbi:hypothetical protein GF352_03415, partial [archaeon]|nr:hypothetical protein [archaeon]